MKNIVMSLWISPTIGQLQLSCIESFLKNGHEFHLYTYNPPSNLPEGVVIKDANEIIEETFIFKDRYNSYATFSDWFRIKLLYDVGGWWVDCDMLCVKKFKVKWPYVFATELANINNHEYIQICNAVIKMPKNSRMGRIILEKIENILKLKERKEIYWTEIGAKLIADVILIENMQEHIVSPEVFCPINYFNYRELIKNRESIPRATYGVHLWNKMWEWNNEDPLLELNQESILGRVFSTS